MSKFLEWPDLPEELIDLVANRLFSKIELLRLRSICKSWRSAVSLHKRFPKHANRNRKRNLPKSVLLYPYTFFRVVLSSNPKKAWLIKTRDVDNNKKLLSPLSGYSIDSSSNQTLDLLDFTVSEIHQSYNACEFVKVVLVENLVFGVNHLKEIMCCNSEEIDHVWTRILDEETENFSDVIVSKGHIYALDLKGAIWWISLSELKIYQYGPSTPMDYYKDIDQSEERRIIEHCGELCIIHRFCKRLRTIGFRVYKMNEELVEWVEIKSLGGKAIVMGKDTCFSVLAKEYYGCLENCIYFIDKGEIVCVFNLGDGIISEMFDSCSKSCFQMFCPPFV